VNGVSSSSSSSRGIHIRVRDSVDVLSLVIDNLGVGRHSDAHLLTESFLCESERKKLSAAPVSESHLLLDDDTDLYDSLGIPLPIAGLAEPAGEVVLPTTFSWAEDPDEAGADMFSR